MPGTCGIGNNKKTQEDAMEELTVFGTAVCLQIPYTRVATNNLHWVAVQICGTGRIVHKPLKFQNMMVVDGQDTLVHLCHPRSRTLKLENAGWQYLYQEEAPISNLYTRLA